MIYRSLAETPADFGPCAITIGNFDGVHCGHRADIAARDGAGARRRLEIGRAHFRSASRQAGGASQRAAFADDAGGARANDFGAGNR